MKPVRAWREGGALYALYDANGSILARPQRGRPSVEATWSGVTERGGDQLKAVFEDPTAPPEERFKGMGCDGGWYDPDAGTRMDTGGEGGANEEAQRRWEAQEYQGPAYRGPAGRAARRGHRLDVPPTRRAVADAGRAYRAVSRWTAACRPATTPPPGTTSPTAACTAWSSRPAPRPASGSGSAEVGLVRRAIGLTRTRDFRSWPPPKLILAPDGQDGLDVSFYGCDYFPLPRLLRMGLGTTCTAC